MKTVSQFMNEDHALLDKLWEDFWQKRSDKEKAIDLISKFFRHFERHLFFENTILFPRFDEHIGMEKGKGPVAVLTQDHKTLIKLLMQAKEIVSNGESEQINSAAKNFVRLLEKHRERENEMGYPVLDAVISPEELDILVKEIYG